MSKLGTASYAEDQDEGDLDPGSLEFGFDKRDFEGLKAAILEAQMEREGQEGGEQPKDDVAVPPEGSKAGQEKDGLGDEDVQQVEQMMQKLLAVRDMGAGLPEDQRKRLAARAVGEVMRDLQS